MAGGRSECGSPGCALLQVHGKHTMVSSAAVGGIWLRSSGLAPDIFIAVFYTGLGLALALAGVLFWIMFARYRDDSCAA